MEALQGGEEAVGGTGRDLSSSKKHKYREKN